MSHRQSRWQNNSNNQFKHLELSTNHNSKKTLTNKKQHMHNAKLQKLTYKTNRFLIFKQKKKKPTNTKIKSIVFLCFNCFLVFFF